MLLIQAAGDALAASPVRATYDSKGKDDATRYLSTSTLAKGTCDCWEIVVDVETGRTLVYLPYSIFLRKDSISHESIRCRAKWYKAYAMQPAKSP